LDICIAEGILVEEIHVDGSKQQLSVLLKAEADVFLQYRMLVNRAPQLLRTLGVVTGLGAYYRQRYPEAFPDIPPTLFGIGLIVAPGDTVERLARRHYLAPKKYATPVYGDLHDHLCEWLSHLVNLF
jgi:hypothetical protein